MRKILAVILTFISLNAHSADEWTARDTQIESAYLVIHTIDWLQTRGVAKHGWVGHKEQNPILGEYPSTKKLAAHYAITSIGHYYIATLLPKEWRAAWQYIAIGDAGAAVYGNHLSGVRIQF